MVYPYFHPAHLDNLGILVAREELRHLSLCTAMSLESTRTSAFSGGMQRRSEEVFD